MGNLPKLAWSRDVTGEVDNIHSNLFQKSQAIKNEKKKILQRKVKARLENQ